MKFTQITRSLVLALASMGLIAPQASVALAAGPAKATRASKTTELRTIADIALTAEGKLQGQVIDRKGTPKGNAPVTISTARGEVVSKVKADAQGYFAAEVGKGGVFTITTSETSVAVRAWTNNSAPKSAHDGMMIVDDRGPVVLGQDDDDAAARRYHMFLFGAGAAAATGLGFILDYNKAGS